LKLWSGSRRLSEGDKAKAWFLEKKDFYETIEELRID
jgi:hypothetical protein